MISFTNTYMYVKIGIDSFSIGSLCLFVRKCLLSFSNTEGQGLLILRFCKIILHQDNDGYRAKQHKKQDQKTCSTNSLNLFVWDNDDGILSHFIILCQGNIKEKHLVSLISEQIDEYLRYLEWTDDRLRLGTL